MSEPSASRRPPAPTLVRLVVLLDLSLGFWAVAIALGYVYLRFENYRLVVDGRKVNMDGIFYSLAANAWWLGNTLGIDDWPGGPNNAISNAPGIQAFGAYKVMTMFAALAIAYLAAALACFALADGLSRGLRWARRSQEGVGWVGLSMVAGYAALYLFASDAPWGGLMVVAGSASVPASMVLAGRMPRPSSAPEPHRRGLGLPAWSLIAAGMMLPAVLVHAVLAWWSLLLIKAYWL